MASNNQGDNLLLRARLFGATRGKESRLSSGKTVRFSSSAKDEPLGSDDELPKESIEDRLSWRRDDPFSDWKIIIIVNMCRADGEPIETKECVYNVRKAVLADGPRRSEYFVRLFDNDGNFSEAQDSTSHIKLTELAAEAFPELLDYVYTVGHEMSFTTERATVLYSLAKYFGIRRLENEAKKFCLQDMNTKTCGTYYYHATILQAESILQAATRFCIDNIILIRRTSRLLRVPNPQFWLDLMNEHAEKGTISNLGDKLGTHIASFCFNHSGILSLDVFKQLTDEKYLPVTRINPIEAVSLLDTERRLAGGECGDKLSSLQLRCINAIAQNKYLIDIDAGYFRDILAQQPPLVLVEIIARGFCSPS